MYHLESLNIKESINCPYHHIQIHTHYINPSNSIILRANINPWCILSTIRTHKSTWIWKEFRHGKKHEGIVLKHVKSGVLVDSVD